MAEKFNRGTFDMCLADGKSPKLRLLATTALGVLFGALGPAFADPDACQTVGATSTCIGNQSQGIASGDDFPSSSTVLNVFGLNSNITPGVDTNGILFSGDTTVEINSNLGNHFIWINGTADGVLGTAPGDVTINHDGSIFNAFRGINAHSVNGDVAIDAEGIIFNSTEAAINAYAPNGGIVLDYTGIIFQAQNRGISAIADGDIEIDQSGIIRSVNQAIFAQSANGSINIDSEGSIRTSSGDAIDAEATGAGGEVTVLRVGDTDAEDRAIFAYANGNASVESYGNVTSNDIDAINVQSQAATASIFSRGDIRAANQGLFAIGATGASIDSRGDVWTDGNDAVFAYVKSGGAGGDATVNSVGDVHAGNRGIRAQADGASGNATIVANGDVWAVGQGVTAVVGGNGDASVSQVGNVTSDQDGGIQALVKGNGDATVNSSGIVNAQDTGISALVLGTGNASITHVGDVTSSDARGVSAEAGGNVTVNMTGNIQSSDAGIYGRSSAANSAVSITSQGDINSTFGIGIHGEAMSAGSTVTINSTGNIDAGGSMGIQALANGNASITSKGDVTSANNGIDAQSATGSASVISVGDIDAQNQGIFAKGGTGASIDSKGQIDATSNDGLFAFATSSGGASVKSRGDVTAGVRGIVAITQGAGSATIDSEGDVSANVQGVFAQSFGGSASVRQIGDVTSTASSGIDSYGFGSGATATVVSKGVVEAKVNGITAFAGAADGGNASVTHEGDVTGSEGYGILAQTNGSANATIVSKGNVQTRTLGVTAHVSGNGNASITHDGNVTSDTAFGIRAEVLGNGDATVDSDGIVHAKQEGVSALVLGTGNASVTHVGDVTSSSSRGVSAEAGGNVTINFTGNVQSDDQGIYGRSTSSNAAVQITSKGDVTTTNGVGIYGEALSGASTVTINSQGDIDAGGGGMGIQAIAQGNASVDSKGNITALNNGNPGNNGIDAQSFQGSASVISVGDVTAQNQGIFAKGLTGASIDSDGDIVANDNDGLFAFVNGPSGNASVMSRGDVTGGSRGIVAITQGVGNASIDSEGIVKADVQGVFAYATNGEATVRQIGDVTSTASNGIEAYAFGSGDLASVTSEGTVQAKVNGITAFVVSSGDASVDHEGNVTADNGYGIVATVLNNGDAAVKSKGNVQAQTQGISAFVGNNGDASITHDGDVTSDNAFAIRADVLGNGNATVDSSGTVIAQQHGVTAYVGGNGNASVTHDGNVNSELSAGIQAQVGGAGNATVDSKGDIQAHQEGILALAQNGNVSVTHVGDIDSNFTYGVNALAFSAGNSVTVDITGDVTAELEGIQAIGFGTNSAVSVTTHGNVTSTQIVGIRSQSLGAGGTASIDSTGNVTAKTHGLFAQADEAVDVKQDGDVSVTFNNAIFAQSINGTVGVQAGGGDIIGNENGIFALGADDVDVTVTSGKIGANVFRAIFAQSTGADVDVHIVDSRVVADGNNGDSDGIFVNAIGGSGIVNIDEDSWITGGSDASASFAVEFGAATGTNTLTNYGIIDDANGGKTIGGDTSAEIVYNYGLVDGDFYLGGGANRFDNLFGGTTYFKAFSSVGAGNDFNNFGVVSPFGETTVGSSVLEGNFNQSGTGTFLADIDLDAGTADYLDVTGDVEAGGEVAVYVTSLGTTPFATTIINSNGAVTDNGIVGVDQGALSVAVTTTATTVDINVAVDFGGFGNLSGNQAALGAYFQSLFEETLPGGLTPEQEAFYLGLLNVGDLAAYKAGLDQLSPEAANAGVAAMFSASDSFAGNLFSCRQRDGAYKYIAETSCAWVAMGGRATNHDGGSGGLDFDDSAFSVSGGAQYKTDGNWAFGFGLGYEHGESDVDPSAELDRDLFNFGLVAKGQFDSLMVGAALSGGVGNIDSTRHLTIPVIAEAVADRTVAYGALTGRAAYLFDMNTYYLKPMIEGAASFVSADGYTETGGGVANQTVAGQDEFIGRGSLSVELGSQFGSPDGVLFRPFVSGGVTFLSNSDIDVEAGFPGLGAGTVTLTTNLDNVYADVRAGVDIFGVSGWGGRLEYDGRFSSDNQQHSGIAKLSYAF